MAWRLHDYIHLKVVSIRLDKPCKLYLPTVSFHNFSDEWFEVFREIRNQISCKIDANIYEDGSYLVNLKDVEEFTDNPHHDPSGLQRYLDSLADIIYRFDKDDLADHALIITFQD